ncbi:MAG: hypothetical protein C5B49_13270 [Bdellovibrio sp.]|nr:MAG: hypothetical protein C5B49_13270 [Bdellovibrio sp.]
MSLIIIFAAQESLGKTPGGSRGTDQDSRENQRDCENMSFSDVPFMQNVNASNNGIQTDSASSGSHKAEMELQKQIKDSGLYNIRPQEFGSCENMGQAWYELLRCEALNTESAGQACGECGDGGKSCGLFQMTKGDPCGGHHKPLGNPFNYQQNIECAVYTWKGTILGSRGDTAPKTKVNLRGAIMEPNSSPTTPIVGESIYSTKYFGPFQRAKTEPKGKAQQCIEKVQKEVCGHPDYNSSQALDWKTGSTAGAFVARRRSDAAKPGQH